MKKSTPLSSAPVLTELLEDTLIHAAQVGYEATETRVRTLLFNLVGEVIVDTIQKGKMDSLLMRNIDTLTQSERLIDASTLSVAECQRMVK